MEAQLSTAAFCLLLTLSCLQPALFFSSKIVKVKMLDVVIVGGGIAGFAAAIALRRAGHAVRVYERSAMNNELGAAIQ